MSSLKTKIIKVIARSTTLDELKGNQVVIATGFGLVSGTIQSDDATATIGTKVLSTILSETTKSNPCENLDANDDYLHLVDVAVHASNGRTYNLSDLVLFADQIIGITIGNIS